MEYVVLFLVVWFFLHWISGTFDVPVHKPSKELQKEEPVETPQVIEEHHHLHVTNNHLHIDLNKKE